MKFVKLKTDDVFRFTGAGAEPDLYRKMDGAGLYCPKSIDYLEPKYKTVDITEAPNGLNTEVELFVDTSCRHESVDLDWDSGEYRCTECNVCTGYAGCQ